MRAAGLAEAPQQYSIGGFQKGNLGWNQAPYRLQNAGKLLELGAFAHIHHQSGASDFSRLQCHLSKAWDQFDGKVIDAVVTQILKSLKHRSLAGTAHSGNDHKFRSMRNGPLGLLFSLTRVAELARCGGFPRRHALDSSTAHSICGRACGDTDRFPSRLCRRIPYSCLTVQVPNLCKRWSDR